MRTKSEVMRANRSRVRPQGVDLDWAAWAPPLTLVVEQSSKTLAAAVAALERMQRVRVAA